MSGYQVLTLMIQFGSFVVGLLAFIVTLVLAVLKRK